MFSLQLLLAKIESTWLGAWRGILHGLLQDPADRKLLQQAACDLQAGILKVTGTSVHLMKLQVRMCKYDVL